MKYLTEGNFATSYSAYGLLISGLTIFGVDVYASIFLADDFYEIERYEYIQYFFSFTMSMFSIGFGAMFVTFIKLLAKLQLMKESPILNTIVEHLAVSAFILLGGSGIIITFWLL
jgi:hypothetical protein